MRARYAYVALVVIILAVTAANILFTVNYVRHASHDFCGVVRAATATPVQRPADPAANPSRVQSWEWYERFVTLGQSLGC